ncbi:unnamed protein product, partial [Polarella glacialis]
MGGQEEEEGTLAADAGVETGSAGEGPKDVESEIRQLISRAKGKLEGVSSVMEENTSRLQTLTKGFKDLKRQQAHVTREQGQSIGQLQNGLTTT